MFAVSLSVVSDFISLTHSTMLQTKEKVFQIIFRVNSDATKILKKLKKWLQQQSYVFFTWNFSLFSSLLPSHLQVHRRLELANLSCVHTIILHHVDDDSLCTLLSCMRREMLSKLLTTTMFDDAIALKVVLTSETRRWVRCHPQTWETWIVINIQHFYDVCPPRKGE